MNNISEHITYKEAVRSNEAIRHGLDNTPGEKELENMRMWADKVFEPTRAYVSMKRGVDTPIMITSFFRSIEVNRKAGGSQTSSHCAGMATKIEEAAGDIETNYPDFTNKDLFYLIKDKGAFDQLIWEFGDDNQPAWVHVSYRRFDNRMEVKRAIIVDIDGEKKTKYVPF